MWTPVFVDREDAVGLKDYFFFNYYYSFSVFYSEGCHSMLRAVSIAAGKMGASLKLTVWLRAGTVTHSIARPPHFRVRRCRG